MVKNLKRMRKQVEREQGKTEGQRYFSIFCYKKRQYMLPIQFWHP